MRPVELRIDRVVVELSGGLDAREVQATLSGALELLGQRLSRAPLGVGADVTQQVMELLELGPVAPDWLAGPGAAARLADALYERIARGYA